jgi:transposase
MDSELLTSSNLKITSEDWALTPSSIQQALLQVLERLAALEEEVSRLRAENERLREQTRRSSRNGSQPPSRDAPSALPEQQRRSSGKQRGAQPGHEGHQRKLYPVEACRSINNHRPGACSACGTALCGEDPNPVRHQVVELPEVKPLVDEHRLHHLRCPECGEVTRAPWPSDVPASGYGPRLAATVGLFSGPYRQSERQVQQALGDFFQVDVALGTVNRLRQEVAQAVAEPVAEATEFAQAQQVANADETGWVQGNSDGTNPERRKAWLWVLVTTGVTIFQVHLSRGQAAATALLGEFAGYLITDRWRGYGWWPLDRRQLCWAHLICEFQKIAERGEESHVIGEGLLAQARKLFELWHRIRDGTLTREGFAAAVVEIRAGVQQWLAAGAAYETARGDNSARARTARTWRELLKVEPALWLFMRVEGIEPTNNAAERALRPAVIWRRTSLGTQSALGSQFVARMLPVTLTLRSQQRSVLEYLTAACEAARQGMPTPALLPDLALSEQEHHFAIAA